MAHCLNDKYDVVIIGAGISGLVCGCYLAKAGMKTLIVEKNDKPGGYCTSFTKGGFTFDSCGHSLGGLSKKGIVKTILDSLNISSKIKMERYNPSDIIVMPDRKFYFWNELDKTIKDLQNNFPNEKGKIKEFFDYINNANGESLVRLKDVNFINFLNQYFTNKKLKAILSILVLINSGAAAYSLSAFTAVKLYKQYIVDNGYYPVDGIAEFPNLLANRFRELGGHLCLSTLATKIVIKKNIARGVCLGDNNNGFVEAKYVISNVDSRYTFLDLLGEGLLNKKLIKKLNTLQVSASMYVLYLGLNQNFSDYLPEGTTNWIIDGYNIKGIFDDITNGKEQKIDWYAARLFKDRKTIVAFTSAFFKDEKYWKMHKDVWMENFIKKIEQKIPNLSKHIIFKEAATPQTLYKYTLNYQGARCGWASTPSQLALSDFSQKTFIDNLYLTGHWTTVVLGIPGVAYLGRDTANIILRREEKYG